MYIQLKSTDSVSGISAYQWYNSGTWTTSYLETKNGVGTMTCSIDRNDTLRFRTIDNAGNVSTESTINVKIDKTVPSIDTISGSNTIANVGTIKVSNISDKNKSGKDGSGIAGYYVSNNSTKPTASSVTWTSLSATSFTYNVSSNATYYVWIKDKVGNISDTKSCTVSGLVTKVTSATYSNASTLIGNYVTPTLSYNGTPKSKTFSSNNTGIATVNSSTGQVYGVAAGTTTITVKITNYDNSSVSKTSTVTISSGTANIDSKHYSTVTNAINDSKSGATINLLKNVTETIIVPENKNLILNLNGKTLSSDTNKDTIYNYGTMTIKNGTIKSATKTGISTAGTLTVSSNVTINGNYYGIIANAGKTNVDGATIKSNVYDGIRLQNAAAVSVYNNANVTGKNHGVYHDGSGRLAIEKANITGNLYGVFFSGTGTTEIKAGTIITGTTKDGIVINGTGILNITGGTITGKNYGVFKESGTITYSGGTLKGGIAPKCGW